MKKGSTKLFVAAAMLVISLVLVAGASLAWFSLSTAPEVTGMQVTIFADKDLLVSLDGENFDQSIDLSQMFKYFAPLKPVSTVDGKNWFLPTYNKDGQLLPAADFILDDDLEHGNVMVFKEGANGLYEKMTGVEYLEATNKGYYVYCDVYLKTELTEDVTVSLSIPNMSGGGHGNLEKWEWDLNSAYGKLHGGKYGSYALASYAKDEGSDIYTIDKNVQTALRVGFLTENDRFVIYEPNADQRSKLTGKPSGDEFYIHDYELIPNESGDGFKNYIDGTYIPTKPIGLGADGKGMVTGIHPSNLIVQKAGAWDEDMLKEGLSSIFMDGFRPNSNCIDSFGDFVTGMEAHDDGYFTFNESSTPVLSSGTPIVTLQGKNPETDETYPQKVRIFIWLEGQDADCWNDIAGGSFVVNLEFAPI